MGPVILNQYNIDELIVSEFGNNEKSLQALIYLKNLFTDNTNTTVSNLTPLTRFLLDITYTFHVVLPSLLLYKIVANIHDMDTVFAHLHTYIYSEKKRLIDIINKAHVNIWITNLLGINFSKEIHPLNAFSNVSMLIVVLLIVFDIDNKSLLHEAIQQRAHALNLKLCTPSSSCNDRKIKKSKPTPSDEFINLGITNLKNKIK
uniref:Uncharacterized protein n=1 Tax=Dikerogammarus haemobaphes virus 1 TaxID=2704946 RepID=A0A6G9HDF4_9VIRU|nr:hypothetical protein [Dikerogammarus haemobaphes virus 1]